MGLTLVVLIIGAARDGWRTSPTPEAKFVVPPAVASNTNPTPEFFEQLVDPKFIRPSAHASSICELADGRMAAVWYAGTREGARDVAIYFATRDPGLTNGWSTPRAIITRETAGEETFRYVKKVGNAVLFAGTNGHLHVLFVTTGFGGWSCSALNLKTSTDGGVTWSRTQRLGLSPFLNISELAKNPPVQLADGRFAVPIYHELLGKFTEMLWLRPREEGFDYLKTRAFGGRTAFQSALVATSETNAVLLSRATGPVMKVHVSRTADAGKDWTAPETIDLPNSNSGLDAIRLADGRLLLVFNDSSDGRENLRLAISADGGTTWRRAGTLVEENGNEFSYPTVLQTRDGLIHVTYTWKRLGIKQATFNVAWVESQLKGARE
jgi:predicted neuraminidase